MTQKTETAYKPGQPVIITIIGLTPVVATYNRALKVTKANPKGGHEVLVQGGKVKVTRIVQACETVDEAKAVVAAFFETKRANLRSA